MNGFIMRSRILLLFVFIISLLLISCKSEKTDYGISAYYSGDYSTAERLASKGCRQKNGEACYILANMYFSGQGVQIDPLKAARLYIKSCDEGNGRACYILGRLYYKGKYVSKDDFQSDAYYRKSNKILIKECNNNNSESCLYSGFLYLHSYGVARDADRALSYFTKSCDLNNNVACYMLWYLYSKGSADIKKNIKLAEEYKEKACKAGYKSACK